MKKTFLVLLLFVFSAHVLLAQTFLLPVSCKSESAKASYRKALENMQHANFEAYTEHIDKAMQEDPTFLMAYAHRALTHISFNQHDKAKQYIQKGLEAPSTGLTSAEHILRKVLVLLDQNPKADPTALFNELVQTYPRTPQAYEMRGVVSYFITKDNAASLKDIKKIVNLSPYYAGGQNMLGYNYMAMGNMKKAKKAFEAYIRMAPEEANPYDSMGEYYMNLKDYTKSAEFYEKAAALGMVDAQEKATKARAMIAQ